MNKQLNDLKQAVDAYILQTVTQLPNCPTKLAQAMTYAYSSGGKRIRSILVSVVALVEEQTIASILPIASSLECIHLYSLIHDDLPGMDDDDYRRGMLTVHKKFDEATAILAGDAFLTLAFELVTKAPLEDSKKVNIVKILSQAAGASGMIAGQMRDIASENQEISLEALKQIHRDKTGQLLKAAIEIGLECLKHRDLYAKALKAFVEHFGLAFQIQNDLQDVCWTMNRSGKQSRKDQKRFKNTYPSLLGVQEAKVALESEISAALAAIESLPSTSKKQEDLRNNLMMILKFVEI